MHDYNISVDRYIITAIRTMSFMVMSCQKKGNRNCHNDQYYGNSKETTKENGKKVISVGVVYSTSYRKQTKIK